MYPQLILRLIESCEDASAIGICRQEIRNRLLPEKVRRLVTNLAAGDFLDWVGKDPDYCYYSEELRQSGISAEPGEAAAMILEAIVLDALE